MIERLMNLNHFTYKKPFSGSDKGNRFKYIIQMVEKEAEIDSEENSETEENKSEEKQKIKVKTFKVTCWAGEKNSKETPDEEKTVREFEFSEEGYDEVLKWLNEESDKIS